jgi:AcrR family transcriptional regulator
VSTSAKEETRARILEAAYSLLIERGYHGVGLDEIARAAGVSRQAIYQHHFKNKSELFVAMVQHSDEKLGIGELVERVFSVEGALARLDAMIETIITSEHLILEIAQVIESARMSDPAADAAWRDRMNSRARFMKQVISGLAEEGLLSPEWTVDDATDLTWALISPATYRALVIDRRWSEKRLIRSVRRTLHDTLIKARPRKK